MEFSLNFALHIYGNLTKSQRQISTPVFMSSYPKSLNIIFSFSHSLICLDWMMLAGQNVRAYYEIQEILMLYHPTQFKNLKNLQM